MRTVNSTALLLALAASAIGLPATSMGCGGEDAQTGEEANIVEGLDDPFARIVLAGGCTVVDGESGKSTKTGGEGGKCPTKVKDVLDVVEAAAGQPGTPSVVSELGDKPGAETAYRFVITQGSKDSKPSELFFSTLASGSGVSQTFLEVMAFSKSKNAYNYYALKGGKWRFMGDGTMIKPGEPAAFECANCHTSGGPLMKELQDGWNNWSSTWFSMPDPMSDDETFKRLFGKKVRADDLEDQVAEGIRAHTDGRVARALKAGELKSLLTQVMCDVAEPNFISTHSKNSQRFGEVKAPSFMFFPPSILATQLMKTPRTGSGREGGYGDLIQMNIPAVDSLSFSGDSYGKALATIGQKIGSEQGDAMFGLFFPQRGYADNMVVEALMKRELLTKETVVDLLMTDFTVPVFSKIRCDLAETAPDKGETAEEIKNAWIANLDGSNLPGAADLEARLETADDLAAHEKAVNDFLTACTARNTAEADAYALDIVKIGSQRRKEFIARFGALVESDDLIPTDSLSDTEPGTWRLSASECKLESAATVGGGGSTSGDPSGGSSGSGSGSSSSSSSGGGSMCAHSECSAGDKLEASCSECAGKVCSADSFCCDNEWDATCVGGAKMLCGSLCN